MSELNGSKYGHVIDFSYVPRKNCQHFKQVKMHIEGAGSGYDPRLYTRCVECGIILKSHVDNVFTKYY